MAADYHSISEPGSTAVIAGSSGNAWNAFQQENAGKGWSKARMAEEYVSVAAWSAALQQQSTNEWNEFQHEHGGKG